MTKGQARMTKGQAMNMKGNKHRACTIAFAMWNVRSLVENASSDRQICRSRTRPLPQIPDASKGPHCVDRKLDILVKKLKRLCVAIAGIQETKWFGKDIWTTDGYTLLHSRSPLPDENKSQVTGSC